MSRIARAILAAGRCRWEHPSTGGTERTETVSEYVVIYEQGPTELGAYCPDLPGLGAAAGSREEVERLIKEAIDPHIESLLGHGEGVPPPTSVADTVAVSLAW
jgi:predicted RNase H-like HicB family nuclease